MMRLIRRRRRGERGFTLIEVLVALVIAAIALSELAQSPILAWRGLAAVRQRDAALAVARNELARAGREWPLENGGHEGAVDGLRFVVVAEPRTKGEAEPRTKGEAEPRTKGEAEPLTKDESRGPAAGGLYWVAVEVSWPDPRSMQRGRVRLATYKRSTRVASVP